jgi:hypothetical protein
VFRRRGRVVGALVEGPTQMRDERMGRAAWQASSPRNLAGLLSTRSTPHRVNSDLHAVYFDRQIQVLNVAIGNGSSSEDQIWSSS